jgi:hypothetical protein
MFLRNVVTTYLTTRRHNPQDCSFNAVGDRHLYVTVNLGFCGYVDEISALLGYYAASCDKPLRTFQNNVSVPSSRVKKSYVFFLDFLTIQGGTDTLSRNVGKQLPRDAA